MSCLSSHFGLSQQSGPTKGDLHVQTPPVHDFTLLTQGSENQDEEKHHLKLTHTDIAYWCYKGMLGILLGL